MNKLWTFRKVVVDGTERKIMELMNVGQEDLNAIRIQLLHLVLEHLKIPLYKDHDFMEHKIRREVYLEELEPYLPKEEMIDPVVELTSFALSFHPDLAT